MKSRSQGLASSRTRLSKKLKKIFDLLLKHFGPQDWWPADTPFEVIVGAILTQNTNWKNVEKAIFNLKKEKLLSIKKIHEINIKTLAQAIRPSGFYKQKAKKLKAFVKFLVSEYNGKLKRFFEEEKDPLRKKLLNVHGIGKETADSIILYAAEKPVFVVDAYTIRIGNRVGLFRFSEYNQVQDFFEANLPKDLETFKEFHALIVELGKNYCKKKPNCVGCPIKNVCSESC